MFNRKKRITIMWFSFLTTLSVIISEFSNKFVCEKKKKGKIK